MKTQIYVWSALGNCPLTNRKGPFCDELVKEVVECATPTDAKAYVQGLLATVPSAREGHFNTPEHPNQSIRSGWVL